MSSRTTFHHFGPDRVAVVIKIPFELREQLLTLLYRRCSSRCLGHGDVTGIKGSVQPKCIQRSLVTVFYLKVVALTFVVGVCYRAILTQLRLKKPFQTSGIATLNMSAKYRGASKHPHAPSNTRIRI